MPALAQADYHVVAVDQRGFGRTEGWDTSAYSHVDLRTFSPTSLVRDIVILVHALGYGDAGVVCLVGHDAGAVVAATCSLIRPDLFHKLVLMSHPFKGAPPLLPLNDDAPFSSNFDIHSSLASLPSPRKHYKWYYSTASASTELSNPATTLKDFLRGYFYLKSASWPGNDPHPLQVWSAPELAKMPFYYIMPLDSDMRDAVARNLVKTKEVKSPALPWFPEAELDVYVAEYARTGFQGALNWYRVQTDPGRWMHDMDPFAGKKLSVPCLFVSGKMDWGNYQEPGAIENMTKVCSDFRGVRFVEGAGHWVQQEQPERVVEEILGFVGS